MDSYSFAAEIAMRFMELDYGLTLDDVLCRPEVAQEFDGISRQFCPGYTPFEYRWAAMAIRKRSSQSRTLARREFSSWSERRKSLPRSKPMKELCSTKYARPGVYIVQNERHPLYVGETFNVKERIGQVMDREFWSTLHSTSVRLLQTNDHLHGLQSALVGRTDPLLNSHLLSPETAEH
jgi:hypothetical protein